MTTQTDIQKLYGTMPKVRRVQDAGVVTECLLAFLNWDQRRIGIRQAQSWARRLLALLPRLDQDLAAPAPGGSPCPMLNQPARTKACSTASMQ